MVLHLRCNGTGRVIILVLESIYINAEWHGLWFLILLLH